MTAPSTGEGVEAVVARLLEGIEKARWLCCFGPWDADKIFAVERIRDARETLTSILALIEAQQAAIARAGDNRPYGHASIAHDGFEGDIIGHYTTREGKRGVVVQQDGTRVVHVYGEKWLATAPARP